MAPHCLFPFSSGTCKISVLVGTVCGWHWLVAEEMKFLLKNLFFFFSILYWFCHTSTWIRHGCTRVHHPEPPSLLPPHTISLGHPSAPAPRFLYPALNLDWRFISYMIFTCFNAILPNHPPLLSQSPKDCSIHLCLFCSLAYRVIITIFLNFIYMH